MLCLARLLEDETVSVVSVTTAEAKEEVYVGTTVKFKLLKQMYEAEVLKISMRCLENRSSIGTCSYGKTSRFPTT